MTLPQYLIASVNNITLAFFIQITGDTPQSDVPDPDSNRHATI